MRNKQTPKLYWTDSDARIAYWLSFNHQVRRLRRCLYALALAMAKEWPFKQLKAWVAFIWK